MNEPLAIETRLAAHVESILNGAAFRKRERDELAEELYGHLWQRWQDAIASGLDEDSAADEAIRSFGESARLGREVTLAYHSRLYASTIGVLVPAVATTADKPGSYYLVWAVLFGTFWEVTGVLVRAAMAWTPVRAGIGVAGGLLAYVAVLIALMACNARQRWALGFAAFELPFLVWWAAVLLWSGMAVEALGATVVGLLAGTATIAALAPARTRESAQQSVLRRIARDLDPRGLARWLYRRPLPRRMLVGLAILLILGSAAPVVALNLPDPTQIGPSELQVGLSVVCTRNDSGELRAVDVTASFVFSRTDAWPNGVMRALGGGGPTDYVAWSVPGSRPNGIPMVTPQATQGPTGRDATDGSTLAVAFAGGDDGRAIWSIPDSARLQAGHRYEIVSNYSVAPGLRDVAPIVFGYDHLERFVLQASATCGQTATGQIVPRLFVVGP